MEKRIELEKRGKDPKMITDLNLDNCHSPNIAGLTDEFINLENLSLNNVGLTTLKGFPELPNLKKLELSENRISNGLHVLLSSPKLTELNLSGNKIKDLTSLEPLKELKNLKRLDLSNNEIIVLEYYRGKVFRLLPQLKYLDGFDVCDEEAASDCDAEVKLNGNDEDAGEEVDDEEGEEEDGNEEDEDEDEEAEEEDEDDIGLETVYKDNLDEESEGEDYEGEGEEFDEDDDIEDEESENDVEGENEGSVRGTKRKHEDEGE